MPNTKKENPATILDKHPIHSKTEEVVLNGKTYIVTTHFNEKGLTAKDLLLRYVCNRISTERKNSNLR